MQDSAQVFRASNKEAFTGGTPRVPVMPRKKGPDFVGGNIKKQIEEMYAGPEERKEKEDRKKTRWLLLAILILIVIAVIYTIVF